ncbi:MAG TPA: PASTA domain-containing protein [bacterium]|nr:PASTA domain-containing protein [bacterium]
MIGRIFSGKYEVTGYLSEGGMALVYRGRRLSDNREVAIKVLREQYAHDKDFVARFEREAQAVARLSHPRMVQLYDSGRDENVHFIVMEFVQGEDLKTLLRRAGPLSESRAREIGAQVCEVLAYAHDREIVHRDIKPQNILLTRDGQVKVTDFGIARALASSAITETGTVLGSVQYLSPEQARGHGVGRSADLYSLGVVLYEAVTGSLPFDGDTPITIALKHVHEAPPPLRRDGEPVSRDSSQIILKALAKDPRDRYRSAEEMREDLLGLAARWREAPAPDKEDTIVASGGGRADEDRRSELVRRLIPAVALTVALLTLFIGVSSSWQALKAYLNVPEVTVPLLTGRSLADAQSLARKDHLTIQVVQQSYSRTVPAGFVLEQDQPAGKVVKVDRLIGVTTSLGPELVTVPDVRRRSLADARFTIEQARLVVGEVREAYDSSLPPGVILDQDPAPGASLERGTSVYLRVNRGPETLVLPDLVGRSLDDARRLLAELGVTLRQVTQVPRPDVPPGQVVGMAPPAGVLIRHGDAVAVTVAAAQGPGGSPPPQPIVTGTPIAPITPGNPTRKQTRITLIVPEGPRQQNVKIVVIDGQGARTAYQKTHAPGDTILTTVSGSGYTIVQIYIDNRLIQEMRP